MKFVNVGDPALASAWNLVFISAGVVVLEALVILIVALINYRTTRRVEALESKYHEFYANGGRVTLAPAQTGWDTNPPINPWGDK